MKSKEVFFKSYELFVKFEEELSDLARKNIFLEESVLVECSEKLFESIAEITLTDEGLDIFWNQIAFKDRALEDIQELLEGFFKEEIG
jgi:hypothetical protein